MKKPYLKKLNFRLFIIGIVILLTAVVIHSCKKDNGNTNDITISDPVVSQAKAWYEQVYPSNVNTGKFTPLNTSVKTGAPLKNSVLFDYTQFIKPYWTHAATYKRFNAGVVELPIDPTSTDIATALSNVPNGSPVYSAKYSRSSFLILNDSAGYHAYIMTIIADSAYINNDLSKLERNKYNKRDADFSGVVLYSTPKGNYVNGWIYKNGSIALALPPGQKQNTTTTANINTANGAQLTRTSRFVNNARLLAITTCYTWTQTTTVPSCSGCEVVVQDLGTTCTTTFQDDSGGDAGAGGTSPGTTSSGGSPAAPPPPPCGVPADANSAALLNSHVMVRVAQSSIDGSGFPSPTSASTTPDPCALVPLTPCQQLATLDALKPSNYIATQDATIVNYQSTDPRQEWGTDFRLTSLTSGKYVNTAITHGTATTWPLPQFYWDTLNGYTISWSHDHPGTSDGIDPNDTSIPLQYFQQVITQKPQADQAFYQSNVTVTTITADGTYVVAIADWNAYTNTFNTTYGANLSTMTQAWQSYAQTYEATYPFADGSEAAAYAIMQIFGSSVNVFFKPTGQSTFDPLTIVQDPAYGPLVQSNPCI